MPTRRSPHALPDNQPDPTPHLYAPAPGMREARQDAGVTLEELSEMTHYGVDLLEKIEASNVPVPRLTTSRISACLAARHTEVRKEGPNEVTRLKDIVPD